MRIPPALYRYRQTNSQEEIAHLIDGIAESKLYLRCPLAFNDQHEGIARLVMPSDEESLSQLAEDGDFVASIGLNTALPIAGRVAMLRLAHPNIQRHLDESETRPFLSAIVACCFSESFDAPLMWAHYAAAFNGVCLRFAPASCELLTLNLEQITFTDEPPEIEMGNALVAGRLLAATKSRQWAYEREWRLILPSPERSVNYSPEALTGLIFGYKVPSETRSSVIAGLQGRALDFFESRPSGYGVQVRALDPEAV